MDMTSLTDFIVYFVPKFCIALVILVSVLVGVAYLIYAERRVIGWMQLRQGPNVVGPFGLLQPFADAIKLLFKEKIEPRNVYGLAFALGPLVMFGLVMMGFAVIPIHLLSYNSGDVYAFANINLSVMYLIAISALEVYGLIMAGWSSNSKYAFYGAIRSVAQMISYELSLGFAILMMIAITGSINIVEMVDRYHEIDSITKLMMAPVAVIFFVAILAETNRHPFDLPEAESELVSGYNVEYSSMAFALFFLGEYANMILKSAIVALLFLGAWHPILDVESLARIPPFVWFLGKVGFLLFVFIWIRAALPRYRYDQLMRIGWKLFLPLTFFWFIVIATRVFVLSHPDIISGLRLTQLVK